MDSYRNLTQLEAQVEAHSKQFVPKCNTSDCVAKHVISNNVKNKISVWVLFSYTIHIHKTGILAVPEKWIKIECRILEISLDTVPYSLMCYTEKQPSMACLINFIIINSY